MSEDQRDDIARAPLTRVPSDLTVRTLDSAIDWCRHEVRRFIAWHVIANAVGVLAIVTPLVWWSTGSAPTAAALGLAAAGSATAARIGVALIAGPLGYRYIRTFTAAPPEYLVAYEQAVVDPRQQEAVADDAGADLWDLDPNHEPDHASRALVLAGQRTLDRTAVVASAATDSTAATDDDPDPAGRAARTVMLGELGLSPTATVRSDRYGRTVDLFSDGDLVVAAADRTSGSVTVLTELAGFRVLVSSALLVPPTEGLVVNVIDDASPARLVLAHQRLVKEAFRSRTRSSDPVGLFKLAQQREVEAYRELGPFWAAMLDLRCRPRGARLSAAPSADDVLLFTGNRLFQHTP